MITMVSQTENPFVYIVNEYVQRLRDSGVDAVAVRKWEMLVLDLIHATTLETWPQFVTFALTVASRCSSTGLVGAIMGIVGAQYCVPQAGEQEAFEGFSSIVGNYEAFKRSPLFSKFRRVVGVLVVSFIAGTVVEEKFPTLYASMSGAVETQKSTAVDMLSDVLSLTQLAWDTARQCVAAKSFAPIFNQTRELNRLAVENALLATHIDGYVIGDMPPEMGPRPAFAARVNAQVGVVKTALAKAKGPEMPIVSRMYATILSVQEKIAEIDRRITVRPAPFAIKLDGTTGVGKTVIVKRIIGDICMANAIPFSDGHIAVVNAADKFQSTVENTSTVVVFDDMANMKHSEMAGGNSSELMNVINSCNNSRVPLNKANLDEKGKVFWNASLVVATTNVKDLEAGKVSNEPSAILRRFHAHVTMEINPDFIAVPEVFMEDAQRSVPVPGGLAMLSAELMSRPGALQSAQHFTVQEYVPTVRSVEQPSDQGIYVPLHAGKLCYSEMIEVLQRRAKIHYDGQARLVAEIIAAEREPLCEHGFTTAAYCHRCHPLPQAGEDDFDNVVNLSKRLLAGTQSPKDEWDMLVFDRALKRERLAGLGPSSPVFAEVLADLHRVDDEIAHLYRHGFGGLDLPRSGASAGLDVDNLVKPAVAAMRARIPSVSTPTSSEGPGDDFGGSSRFERLRSTITTAIGRIGSTGQHVRRSYVRARSLVRNYLAVPPIAPTRFDVVLERCGFVTDVLVDNCVMRPRVVLVSLSFALPCVSALLLRVASHALGVSCDTVLLTITMVFCTVLHLVAHRVYQLARLRVGLMTVQQFLRRGRNLAARSFDPIIVGFMAALPMLLVVHRMRKPKLVTQGGTPSVPVVLVERPAATPFVRNQYDAWEKRDLAAMRHTYGSAKTMNREQSLAKLQRSVMVAEVHYEAKVQTTMALMPCTNYAVMPKHNFFRVDGSRSTISKIVFRMTSANFGPVFTAIPGETNTLELPGDMMLFYTAAGGSLPDVRDQLMQSCPSTKFPAIEVGRDLGTCEPYTMRYMARPTTVVNHHHGYRYTGLEYARPEPTHNGLCGAVICTDTPVVMVAGLHTMGAGTTGQACPILRGDLDRGIEELRKRSTNWGPPIPQSHTDISVPEGYEYAAMLEPLAARSIMRETDAGCAFLPMGTISGFQQVRPRTQKMVSRHEELISSLLGQERSHEPPRTIGQATVDKKRFAEIFEATQVSPDDLRLAQADLEGELDILFASSPELRRDLRPLSEEDACSGIIGDVSVNRMALNTAPGYPRSGTKERLVQPSLNAEDPDRIVLTPEMAKEVEALYAQMASGERINVPFKMTHKDEAVKIGKKKTRVFEAGTMAFTVLTRMFFLPIMRVMYASPLFAESGVGVNAQGPSWDNMIAFLSQYNAEDKIVGDWQSFDGSVAYQEMLAVFSILIALAEKYGGYSAEEVTAMWVIAEEIARHYSICRGDVCYIEGTNPSGNALTVFINNMVNGVRMRAAFYALAAREEVSQRTLDAQEFERFEPLEVFSGDITLSSDSRAHLEPLLLGLRGRFRDYVLAVFYGDDFVLSPKKLHVPWYTQRSIAGWFAEYGKTMTDPSKAAFTSDYTPDDDVDFLKRKWRLDSEIGRYMAPLAEKSITKPLFVVPMKFAYTEEFYYAEVISAALREYFQYGREKFAERATPLCELAEQLGACPFMDVVNEFSFDFHLERYERAEKALLDTGRLVSRRE